MRRRASSDGSLPVSGSDDAHEWKGYIPFDEMHRVYDPESGILASANGRITPDGYKYSISTEMEVSRPATRQWTGQKPR